MKKLSGILIIFITAAALTGCDRSHYLAEKAFYNAQKLLANVHNIYTKSDSKDPSILEPAVAAFEKIVEKYPSSPKSAEALFVISQLRKQQGNIVASRDALNKIVQNYTGMGSWAEDARYRIAQLYEEEGNWDAAEKAYWDVVEYHPMRPKGLYAPIYILNHYKAAKDTVGEQRAYQKSVDHFQKILKEAGEIELSVGIRYFLGIMHASSGSWQEARDIWLQGAKDIKESYYTPLSLLAAAEVSWRNNDFVSANQIYDQFYTEHADHPLAAKVAVRRSMLYHQTKEYAKEREWLAKSAEQYFSTNTDALADIKLMTGKSFQDEGLWADAEKVYKELETAYPNTGAALQVPLMSALYQEAQGQTAEVEKLLESAITRYQQLGEEQPDSPIAAHARRLANEAYAMKGDWKQVIANVDQDMERETVETRKGSWLFLKALIAENRIGDKLQAQSLFESFLKAYPDHPLAKIARNRLDGLISAASVAAKPAV